VEIITALVPAQSPFIPTDAKIVVGAVAPASPDPIPIVLLPASVAVAPAEHIRQFPSQPVTLPWEATGKQVTAHLLFTAPSTGNVIEQSTFNGAAWHRARRAAAPAHGQDTGFHALRPLLRQLPGV
jgi:hypothetical protein